MLFVHATKLTFDQVFLRRLTGKLGCKRGFPVLIRKNASEGSDPFRLEKVKKDPSLLRFSTVPDARGQSLPNKMAAVSC